ncbi:MAG: NADH-quinone oxidoreductase subunit L [Verrucomicrobia bacterium]|nr:NADH-quinone oxidoreductase subunit L [Verrucomicrobiota bacterium]
MDHSAAPLAVTSSHAQDLAWVVLLFPLVSALSITFGLRRSRTLTNTMALSAVVTGFFLSVALFLGFGFGPGVNADALPWLSIPGLNIHLGLKVDSLSTLMLMVVTGISSLVHLYSTQYMDEDQDYPRYFAALGLFTFAMLGIVLSDNLVQTFIFWELVGVTSYLLVGFWYEKPAAADAAKKAFLTNRIGDFGFILGIVIVWAATGTVQFDELAQKLHADPKVLGNMASLAGVLIFLGAMGKSAQVPLHVWLPDAMEGPTPVSALIHAATMVAAGVYMLCRVFFLLDLPAAWPDALSFLSPFSALGIIAWVGGITSLLAGLIAIQQDDIKRILAYSTLSQLGYMIMAVGCAGPDAAMFHLTTHACFKALLFLGAGSVIVGCHHEQNIWKMGGLWKRMPTTAICFAIGTAALCGVPVVTAGFYSKDAIFAAALADGRHMLFGIGILVAGLTTLYMARLFLVAFLGTPRSEQAEHAHESPWRMTLPLTILAFPSVALGWLPIGGFLKHRFFPEVAVHYPDSLTEILFEPFNHSPLGAVLGLGMIIFGAFAAVMLYWSAAQDPLPDRVPGISRALSRRLYFDQVYEAVFIPLHDAVAALADWFDRWIVQGFIVRGASGGVELFGRGLRLVQTGNLQTYAFFFVAGVALVVLLALN